MPADTPDDDQMLPSRTTRSSTTVTSPSSLKRASEFQWVVAFFPDRRPALCKRKVPVQTERTSLQCFACSAIKRTKSGLSTSLRVPSPPGTRRKSSLGLCSKDVWGLSERPLAHSMGSCDCAIMSRFSGPPKSLPHMPTISQGPMRSNSSRSGKTRKPKFILYLQRV